LWRRCIHAKGDARLANFREIERRKRHARKLARPAYSFLRPRKPLRWARRLPHAVAGSACCCPALGAMLRCNIVPITGSDLFSSLSKRCTSSHGARRRSVHSSSQDRSSSETPMHLLPHRGLSVSGCATAISARSAKARELEQRNYSRGNPRHCRIVQLPTLLGVGRYEKVPLLPYRALKPVGSPQHSRSSGVPKPPSVKRFCA